MIVAKESLSMYEFDFSTYVSNAIPAEGWIDWHVAKDVLADFIVMRSRCTVAVTADGGTVQVFSSQGAFAAGDTTEGLGLRLSGDVSTHSATKTPLFGLNEVRTWVAAHDDGDMPGVGASYPRYTHSLTTTKVGTIFIDVFWCLDGGER